MLIKDIIKLLSVVRCDSTGEYVLAMEDDEDPENSPIHLHNDSHEEDRRDVDEYLNGGLIFINPCLTKLIEMADDYSSTTS